MMLRRKGEAMQLYVKDVEKIGFKGSGLFDDSKWFHFYYAKKPALKKIYVIDSIEQTISHFDLSAKEWKEFERGKLSLIPIGCCCATGGKYKDNPSIDFQGDFKTVFGTKNKTLKFIEGLIK